MKKLICFALVFAVTSHLAYCGYLITNDAVGTSSFNSGLHWDDGQAPYSGQWYSTAGYLLRTPSTAGSYTFGGYSLTVGGGDGGGANPFLTTGLTNGNCLINKTPGNPVITVPYLYLDQGYIRDGMGSTDSWTLDGVIDVSQNGGGLACQCRFDINSMITGYGPLYIADNGTSDDRRVIFLNNFYNEYRGSIYLLGYAPDSCRLTFSENSRMNFIPQYGGYCNSISGIGTVTYNGAFYFDFSWGVGTTAGDSWMITNAAVQTFGPSFYVMEAQPMGNGIWWKQDYNGIMYSFDQNTGMLTCLGAPVTVLSPNGGERYAAGSTVQIKYATAVAPGTSTVTIMYIYTYSGGAGYGTIASTVPNEGSYLWTTPDVGIDLDTFVIRVTDDYWGFSDDSDAPFTIFRCSEANPADINKDCYIDLQDLAILAQSWLWCSDPYNSACTIN
jgi:hypothetical protein